MLEFRKITLEDQTWISKLLKLSDFMGAEYSFANNMAWCRLSDSSITRYKDFYIVLMPHDDTFMYTFPAGQGDYVEVINLLREYSKAHGKKCAIFGVVEPWLSWFQEHFDGEYHCQHLEDSSDYIYLAQDLIDLKGRKYHSKRNHLKKVDAYPWTYEKLSKKDFEECITFSANLYNSKDGYTDHSAVVEQYAIDTFFKYFEQFNLMGIAIRVDGKLVAYSIGEKLNSNTVVVHIEKADTSYDGMYVLINNLFAKEFCNTPDVVYINREEDLGIEGIRKAKLSYRPVFKVEKHLIEFV